MKKLLAWPAPLLQKWLLSLLLCLPFLAAAIVSAFSGDRTFLILSALLLLFCGVRCAELYVMLANERYCAEEGICLSVSSIPFQRQRRVALQKADGEQLVFCIEKNKQLSVGQAYSRLFDTTTRRHIMQYTDNEAALIGGLISNYFLRPAVSAALKDSYTRVLEHLRTGRVSAADLKQIQKALAFLTPTCQMSREAQRDLMGASLKTTALLSSCR